MRALRALVGPIFVVAGALHFKRTPWYEAMMPDYLPAHRALVYASGAAEMAGGAGLMVPATRRRDTIDNFFPCPFSIVAA